MVEEDIVPTRPRSSGHEPGTHMNQDMVVENGKTFVRGFVREKSGERTGYEGIPWSQGIGNPGERGRRQR